MSYYKRKNCRYCNSSDLTQFISLGEHPPSNSFISSDQIEKEKKYPLDVYFCNECYLVQLLDVVSADSIFDNYHYLSSSSKALVNHFSAMTEELSERFHLKPFDIVVDIGCNDGITLNTYRIKDLMKIGVEPSNVADIAIESGLTVIKSFFSKKVAHKIVNNFGHAKIITATNVFAHIDDMNSFMEGIPDLLDDDGVLIVEVSYLIDLIDNYLFDTIYHEHLCYLSLNPVISFIEKFDLEVFDVKTLILGASGPAIRFLIQKKSCNRQISNSVRLQLKKEKNWGVDSLLKYETFSQKIEVLKIETLDIIKKLKMSNAKIGGFGAPAKGNTLLNYYKLSKNEIQSIADNTELKQGKLTPGTHIPIISDEMFIKEKFDYALLLSWNYKEYFLKNSTYINNGGKFIIPFPEPHILPK